MSRTNLQLPDGVEVLEATGKGNTSNVTLLVRDGSDRFVLKIYRHRRSRLREALRSVSHRFLEQKRGASARARCETERVGLALWHREGFDVVRALNRPIPAWVRHPALWLEYCPFPTVQDLVRNPSELLEAKQRLVRRFAAALARRHARAVELREPLLLHEHGTLNHFFVSGDRIIAFDLENGFRASMPVLEAVSQELSSLARALIRDAGADADSLLAALAAGYADRELLRRALEHALSGPGLARRLRRWHQPRRPAGGGKIAAARRLLEALQRPIS
jgi:hypothetical protein